MNNNKVYNGFKGFFLLFFVICLILFNTSCGLDTFYYIEAPVAIKTPEYDDIEGSKMEFQFSTTEGLGAAGFKYLGTEVYYKIYNNKSEWESEKNYLNQLQANNDITAADRLIFPVGANGYGYQKLQQSNNIGGVLIPFVGRPQSVNIRLNDYTGAYSVGVVIDGKFKGTPLRYNGKSFDFTNNKPNNFAPSDEELDVKKNSSSPSDHKWYVCMYAVAKGRDSAYINYFSNISYLGTVTILDN